MKAIVPVLGLISALWIFGGSKWISNMSCGSSNTAAFSVTDGSFSTQSSDLYTFGFSNDKPANLSNETQKSLNDISTYLLANPNIKLTLTGQYGSQETNSTNFENLGEARAESMKSFLLDKKAPIDQIETFGVKKSNLSFNEDQQMYGGVDFLLEERGEASEKPSDAIEDTDSGTGDSGFSEGDVKRLDIDGNTLDLDLIEGFDDYISGLKNYMDENPSVKLTIDTYHSNSKTGNKISRDVRKYLMGKMDFERTRFDRNGTIEKPSNAASGEPNVSLYFK